ncbi:hypothetical protein CSC17_5514 [Klebsiella oxytoca]|nr:hypothetical protein CSC17_5514 [Klebsiella oxytoca]
MAAKVKFIVFYPAWQPPARFQEYTEYQACASFAASSALSSGIR